MGTNKIGLHILNGTRTPLGTPRVVKLVNVSPLYVREVRNTVGPKCLIIVRWETTHQPLDNPAQNAQEWFDNHLAEMRAMNDANVLFEGDNEHDLGKNSPEFQDRARAFCAKEVKRLQLMHAAGFRSVIGNFSVGHPHQDLWPLFAPMLNEMWAGDYLGLHEYWEVPTELDDRWICGRWTIPEIARYIGTTPIVVTEIGHGRGGWKQNISAAQYLQELEKYNALLEAYPNVVGAVVFSTVGPAQGWASYDPSDLWGQVIGRYTGESWTDPSFAAPVPQPKPPSVPTDPVIEFYPTTNWGYPRGVSGKVGRKGHAPIAIIYHVSGGSLRATRNYILNPASEVSYHFCVGVNGEIEQYVDEANAAWHAGHVEDPKWSLLIPGANPNWYTISIAREGQPTDSVPEKMYQSLLWLTKKVLREHHIVPSQATLTGHFAIDSRNKKNCPGPTFPWERLYRDLGIAGTPVQEGSVNVQQLRQRFWGTKNIPYTPTNAFPTYATKHNLGAPETPEVDWVEGGVHYRGQGFANGIVYCKVGDWGNIIVEKW